jgi:hypothetical protein
MRLMEEDGMLQQVKRLLDEQYGQESSALGLSGPTQPELVRDSHVHVLACFSFCCNYR